MDFCSKYQHDQLNKKSLKFFTAKIKEKKQNTKQLHQAFHAISVYYELALANTQRDNSFKDKNKDFSIKKRIQKVSFA